MSETETLFGILRQSADAGCAAAIEGAVANAPDDELCRVNALAFAAKNKLDEERTIAAFLHAARLGLFELSWNVLCPDCGGVLDAATTLKTVNHDEYSCALCAAGYKPTLDEMVEVTFTVNPRVRRIAGHDPDTLPEVEYYRQIFWSSGMDLPDDLAANLAEFTIDSIEVPPGAKAVLSVQLPEGVVIAFDPVTHSRQIITVKGEPTRDKQALSIVFSRVRAPLGTVETEKMRPGPLRLSIENHTNRRVLPALWVSSDALHHLLGKRRPFLTAKRLLTNQTFRDLYNTDTLDPNQRLKITSLTFLFTDLKGSTALALRMREAMVRINTERGNEDLLLKIGIHEGPCLAVRLNNSQDYFGQTVNIAARVQGLASSRAIFVTQPVLEDSNTAKILHSQSLHPSMRRAALRGIADETTVYEIP